MMKSMSKTSSVDPRCVTISLRGSDVSQFPPQPSRFPFSYTSSKNFSRFRGARFGGSARSHRPPPRRVSVGTRLATGAAIPGSYSTSHARTRSNVRWSAGTAFQSNVSASHSRVDF